MATKKMPNSLGICIVDQNVSFFFAFDQWNERNVFESSKQNAIICIPRWDAYIEKMCWKNMRFVLEILARFMALLFFSLRYRAALFSSWKWCIFYVNFF